MAKKYINISNATTELLASTMKQTDGNVKSINIDNTHNTITVSIGLYLESLVTSTVDFYFFKIRFDSDFLFLLILGTLCTAYAITFSIEVMKQLNPFTIMLIINMEPIYGIFLALMIFGESELMSSGFYIGLLIILGAIISNSIIKVYKN